ncbi:hypothetical protein AVEN_66192-1 [Araneus ventricosus]|uniref:Uncharacterized protein n=1 Tax=Araneus ventricosus TaxID=182803 RepID=A0A4Y2VEF3_ARAVE|nr:hypothetical protein AVEN_66192-1 [Araneus ventricosus]
MPGENGTTYFFISTKTDKKCSLPSMENVEMQFYVPSAKVNFQSAVPTLTLFLLGSPTPCRQEWREDIWYFSVSQAQAKKSPNIVEFRQISYNHSLGDLARFCFTIGTIYARLTENRFAWRLGSCLVHNWRICARITENHFAWLFTVEDISARLTENCFALGCSQLATFVPG